MSGQPELGQLVTAVFRGWQQTGIPFLVLRNYEGLPAFTTNDIDVLVAPDQIGRAERTLVAAAREAGFRLHNRAEFATLALYLSSTQSNAQAHFDLFTALKWRGFDFLDSREFLGRRVSRGLFAVPHPVDEAATNLLAYMIYTGKVKPKYMPSIAAGFRSEPALAAELLAKTYGSAHARFLVEAGAQEQWAALEAATGALRRALIVRQVTRQPWRTVRSGLRDAGRLTRRFLRPPGLTVVLCGADGCGKSTAARAVEGGLSCTFSPLKGRHYHWKPPLFAAKRRAARGPATDPHGQPLRNPVASFCFFLFHWQEFFLGSHLCFRPRTFRGGLVLVDRYYYDFFVDQRRYRLRVPRGIVRLGYAPLKKPDLVLLLDAPAEVLQSRKQEVPFAETERQCRAYRALVESLSNGRVINAAQPVGKVGADINRAILEFMVERTQKRWGKEMGHPPSPMTPSQQFWQDLFAAGTGESAGLRVPMRVVSKHGRPFLLVPCQARAAAVSLSLYPAQTPRARLARTVLRWLVRAGAPLGTKRASLTVPSGDAFAEFLSSLAGAPQPGLPTLGILAGNPASAGQRFLLLVFDGSQTPVAVVKAGLSEQARSLIEKEASFLAAVPPNATSIPRLRSVFQSPRLRALALDFFAGDSPGPRDEATLPALLASWVAPERTVAMSETADWARLEGAASANDLFVPLARQLRGRTVHPVIQHGDFAPWNIKVSPGGAWTVLDWERGELAGIPAWDWFHYVVQPALLVEHLPTQGLIQRVEALLSSEAFKAYAARARIIGGERELFLAYLLHAVEVIKPSEGLTATRDLLRALAARWRQG